MLNFMVDDLEIHTETVSRQPVHYLIIAAGPRQG